MRCRTSSAQRLCLSSLSNFVENLVNDEKRLKKAPINEICVSVALVCRSLKPKP
jgi:hypothetical protein